MSQCIKVSRQPSASSPALASSLATFFLVLPVLFPWAYFAAPRPFFYPSFLPPPSQLLVTHQAYFPVSKTTCFLDWSILSSSVLPGCLSFPSCETSYIMAMRKEEPPFQPFFSLPFPLVVFFFFCLGTSQPDFAACWQPQLQQSKDYPKLLSFFVKLILRLCSGSCCCISFFLYSIPVVPAFPKLEKLIWGAASRQGGFRTGRTLCRTDVAVMWFVPLPAFPWLSFGWCFLVDEETSCCGSARGRVLVGMADPGFVWINGGWLVGFHLNSGAGVFPLHVIVLFLSMGWPLREQRKRLDSLAYLVRKKVRMTFALW